MNIAVVGPPGSGKGTHTKKIISEFGLHYVSTGELLRENLEKQTGLGFMAKQYMDQGEMVPSEVVDAMVVEHLRNIDSKEKLLFNGFPRTTYQAQFLDDLFENMNRQLDAVIYLKASDETIVNRLSERLICGKCQAPFHKTFNPFKTCPYNQCTGEYLYRRDDDNPEMARARLGAFHRLAEPLINYYQKTNRLFIVDSDGGIEEIDQAIFRILEAVQRHDAQPATYEEIRQIQALKQTIPALTPDDTIYPSLDIIFLGAPGAGKGTQAAYVSQQFNILRIATGDLFRENIKNETELGKVAKSYMDHGKLVPDDVTEAMIRERLTQPDVRHGFILDGFPRNLPQAEALSEIMTTMRRRLAGVFYLKVSDREIITRLSGRMLCHECQTSFHKVFNPFRNCPDHNCRGEFLYQRDDDKPETVRARLKIFHGETEPLVGYYRDAGLLIEIDGEGDLPVVRKRVMAAAETLRWGELE